MLRLCLLLSAGILVTTALHNFNQVVIPVHFIEEDLTIIRTALIQTGAPKDKIPELMTAVHHGSRATGINPLLLVALTKTESAFNYQAVSPKKYKGLMQTPTASMRWADVDILHGARILEEKLRIAKGSLPFALALYKGGDNKQAHQQANEVLILYKRLKEGK